MDKATSHNTRESVIQMRCELLLLFFRYKLQLSVKSVMYVSASIKLYTSKRSRWEKMKARSQNISPHRHDRESVCNPFSSVNRERISCDVVEDASHIFITNSQIVWFLHTEPFLGASTWISILNSSYNLIRYRRSQVVVGEQSMIVEPSTLFHRQAIDRSVVNSLANHLFRVANSVRE